MGVVHGSRSHDSRGNMLKPDSGRLFIAAAGTTAAAAEAAAAAAAAVTAASEPITGDVGTPSRADRPAGRMGSGKVNRASPRLPPDAAITAPSGATATSESHALSWRGRRQGLIVIVVFAVAAATSTTAAAAAAATATAEETAGNIADATAAADAAASAA